MTPRQARSWLRKYGYTFTLVEDSRGRAHAVTYPGEDEPRLTGWTRKGAV